MSKTFIGSTKPQKGEKGKKKKGLRLVIQWSSQQLAVCEWFAKGVAGHLIVRARAGTGKTTTIFEAIGHIPGPGRVLVCAFNKRIERAATARLQELLATTGKAVYARTEAKTFHGLCYGFLRDHWPDAHVDDRDPSAVEEDRIEGILIDKRIVLTHEELGVCKKLVSWAKGCAPFAKKKKLAELCFDIEGAEEFTPEQCEKIGRVARLAMKLAAEEPDDEGRISFDDMIFIPVVNGWLKRRYRYVIADEAQDMNEVQLLAMMQIVRSDGHLIFVGDDRQTIYVFRGAALDTLDKLKVQLQAKELPLTITYRCPYRIVEEARKLVPDFRAATDAPEGSVVTVAARDLPQLCKKGDVVLSRVNAPLVGTALRLIANDIPAIVAGRDIGESLVKIVKRVKGASIEDFLGRLKRFESLRRERILATESPTMGRRLGALRDNVLCLQVVAERMAKGASVKALMEKVAGLFAEADDSRAVVTLSSIHKAKGLEWDRVFLLAETLYLRTGRWRKADLQDVVPGAESLPVDTMTVDPEEQNLHYVALTRAKSVLHLVYGLAPLTQEGGAC